MPGGRWTGAGWSSLGKGTVGLLYHHLSRHQHQHKPSERQKISIICFQLNGFIQWRCCFWQKSEQCWIFEDSWQMKFDWAILMGSTQISFSRLIRNQFFMKQDENSFEQYKRYLEKSLGITDLQAPKPPMNPYMRFFLERSSEERSKGEKKWNELTKFLAEEWKRLPDNKKDYYEKIYNIRLRERNNLYEEYQKLTGKRRALTPYARFLKKRYHQYEKEYKNSSSGDINKMVKNDWKALSQKEKKKYQDEFEKEKNDLEADIDNTDKINEYEDKLQRYHEQLREDRQKILRKFGITKESRAKVRRQQREEERLKRRAQRQLASEQRRQEQKERKQKLREARLKKIKEERDAIRQRKEEDKQKEREAKQQAKEEAAKKRSQSQRKDSKSKPKVKAEKVVKEKKATPVKKSPKAKPIKKAAVKKAKTPVKSAKKAASKPKPKTKKSKAKGAKRGRKGK